MADKQEPEATDVAEPSTNDETQDTDVESLEGVSDADFDLDGDTEESESEEAATDSDEEPAEDGESEEQSEDSNEDSQEESSDEEQSEESEDESESSEEVTPSEDKSAARKAWEEREARRQAQKQKQQEEYLDSADDEKDLALRQLQIEAYNNKIERNANRLQNDIDRAIASIDLFRTGTPEQQEALLREVDKWEAINVTTDKNGDPIEVRGNLYQYLQNEANSISRLAGVGARQQERAKSRTKAKTLTPPSAKPKEPKKDTWDEALEEAFS